MPDTSHLVIKRADDSAITISEWRAAAAKFGITITDNYRGINPFSGETVVFRGPGSGYLMRDDNMIYVRFRGTDAHICEFSDRNDQQLQALAAELGAELLLTEGAGSCA